METRKRFRPSFLLLLFFLSAHTTYGQNDSIVARTELERLNQLFGYRTKMNFITTEDINSLRSNEINISLAYLKRISSVSSKAKRLYIVRFIVAHEFAHQVQYYKYKDNKRFMNDDLQYFLTGNCGNIQRKKMRSMAIHVQYTPLKILTCTYTS